MSATPLTDRLTRLFRRVDRDRVEHPERFTPADMAEEVYLAIEPWLVPCGHTWKSPKSDHVHACGAPFEHAAAHSRCQVDGCGSWKSRTLREDA